MAKIEGTNSRGAMKRIYWRYRTPILTGIFGAIACVLFVDAIATLYGDSFCSADDRDGTTCLREWVSALSGWAGAIAASVTLVALYRQIAEQKKQTNFILGDAEPTLDCLQDVDDPTQIIIRLVNWNRRTVLLHALGADNLKVKDRKFEIVEIKKNDVVVKNHSNQPYLQGWEDRAKAPHSLKIKLTITKNGVPLKDFPSDMMLKAKIRLIGKKHDMIELQCGLHPNA